MSELEEEVITEEEVEETTSTGDPKVVILHNDDFNTFDHVEECLIRICEMTPQKAHLSALMIHFKGKCIVAEGNDEFLKKIKLKLRAEGLSVTIENA